MGSLDGSRFLLLLRGALRDQGLILSFLFLLAVHTPAVDAAEVAAALETNRGN